MNISTLNEEVIRQNPYSRLIISKQSPLHKHTFFEFSVCLSGSVQNVINGKPRKINKGRIILLRPQDVHQFFSEKEHTSRDVYITQEEMREICDLISTNLFDKILNTELLIDFTVSSYNLNLLESNLNYFNNLSNKSAQSLKIKHINCILNILDLWQHSLSQKNAETPEWVSTLISKINTENYITKSVSEIITLTNYSHGFVCREFKKYMGTTLQNYLSDVKLSYSLSLLCEKDLSIETIAEKLNYCEVTNYIIAFKKKFGITPSKWRKNNI